MSYFRPVVSPCEFCRYACSAKWSREFRQPDTDETVLIVSDMRTTDFLDLLNHLFDQLI
jgi:hypothetical protein